MFKLTTLSLLTALYVCVYLLFFAVTPGSALSSTITHTALLMDLTMSLWLFATKGHRKTLWMPAFGGF